MTHRVGAKGQIVVPKRIRDRLGIKPGDEVAFEEGEKDVRVRRVEGRPSLRGALEESGLDPLEIVESEHRREIERDRPAGT